MRDNILEKAIEMFLTLGFKSVTMDDIAAALGISKKTIYQHFANKTELVQAVTLQLFEKIAAGIDTICSSGKNPVEEIFMVRKFLIQNLRNEDASPWYQLQKFFPELHEQLRRRQFEKMHSGMIQNLERGVKQGFYRADIDIEFISRIYFTGLSGIKDMDIFPGAQFRPEELTLKFLEYHFRGISTPAGLLVLRDILENDVMNLIKF